MRPLFGVRAKAATARSMSLVWRTSTGVTCTPIDGARAWIAAKYPIPAVMTGSRSTAARVTRGAISLSTSSHFPPIPNSKEVNPVALPTGQACDIAAADRIGDIHEHDGHGAARVLQRSYDCAPRCQNDFRGECD